MSFYESFFGRFSVNLGVIFESFRCHFRVVFINQYSDVF